MRTGLWPNKDMIPKFSTHPFKRCWGTDWWREIKGVSSTLRIKGYDRIVNNMDKNDKTLQINWVFENSEGKYLPLTRSYHDLSLWIRWSHLGTSLFSGSHPSLPTNSGVDIHLKLIFSGIFQWLVSTLHEINSWRVPGFYDFLVEQPLWDDGSSSFQIDVINRPLDSEHKWSVKNNLGWVRKNNPYTNAYIYIYIYTYTQSMNKE